MKSTLRQILAFVVFVLASAFPGSAAAQVTYSLDHSIPAPPTVGVQNGANFGSRVAVDGGFTAVGVPGDNTGAQGSGVVKVFDSTTGALLFVLPNPSPAAGGGFGSQLAISGTRVVVGAYVYDLSSATPTVPVATLNHSGSAVDDNFGGSVGISGTRVVVGASRDDTGASNAGSAYVYDLSSATPTVPVATLNNPGPAVDDFFGNSVAISGTRVVVGAFADDTGASGAGSAYVYDLSGATPTVPVATLNNPEPAANDKFGISVAISGTRVVVGAYSDNTGATRAGSAYVYDLSSGTPTVPVATLNNPDPAVGDAFGNSVAISGTRVVVGNNNSGGDANVYDLSSATPTVPMATLNSPHGQGDAFGRSVAISGTRVVVGAPYYSAGGYLAGSAYVYDVNGATPTVPVLTLSNAGLTTGDIFGNAVAISGTRVVIGARYDDTGAEDAGSAYVYDLSSGTPTLPVATFHKPSPVPLDYFGWSVAIAGTRVVIGAPADGTTDGAAGSAYVYDLSSATPTVPIMALDNPGLPGSHLFGKSVAISGTRVVVGVPYDDTGALGAGRAYVYDLNSATPTVAVVALDNPNPAAFDQFGFSVAISGTRVVVGVPFSDIGAADSGRAYVFDLSSASPEVPVRTLNNPGPAANDEFGYSVAISGTRVVVVALLDDTGATDSGSAYVYDLSSATPTVPVATLNNPGPAVDDRFGFSVAISGTRVVVGAYGDDTGAGDAGSVYVYDLSSATPAVPVTTINNPGPATGDIFGSSVAMDSATVAIGAPFDDTVAPDKGFAYVFTSDADGDGLLDGWEIAHFGTTTGHSALDDADGDGRSELLELAFNTNPLASDAAAAPLPVDEGGFLTMTVAKRPGINWEVQSAGTLLPALSDSFSPATTTVLIDSTTTLKVRDNVLIDSAPARFMRTKVTAAP